MANELQSVMDQHGEDLQTVISNTVSQNENEKSFVSKEEIENLLENHFKRVEELVDSYSQQSQKGISISDLYEELQEKLKEMLNDFSTKVKERFAEAKQGVVNQVDDVRNDIRDSVDEVKESAIKKIQNGISGLNEKLKDFSQNIDEKFGLNKQSDEVKEINHDNPYEEALNIQENYGLVSNTVQWDNKEFLNHLKEVDPNVHKEFLALKDSYIVQSQQLEGDELSPKDQVIKDLKQELESLKSENNQLKQGKQGLQSKMSKVENFFQNNNSAFKEFNNFLINDKGLEKPEIKKEEILRNDQVNKKEVAATKKVERGISI